MEPKIGTYVQYQEKIADPYNLRISKLLGRVTKQWNGCSSTRWKTCDLSLMKNKPWIGRTIGGILDQYIDRFRPARINSIFRYKIEIEYSQTKIYGIDGPVNRAEIWNVCSI